MQAVEELHKFGYILRGIKTDIFLFGVRNGEFCLIVCCFQDVVQIGKTANPFVSTKDFNSGKQADFNALMYSVFHLRYGLSPFTGYKPWYKFWYVPISLEHSQHDFEKMVCIRRMISDKEILDLLRIIIV